jgi:tetratricopeptide (TPR) repeat protein
MVYDDFVIQILPGQGDSYAVRVESRAGRGDGRFEVPPDLHSGPWETLSWQPRDFRRNSEATITPRATARGIGGQLFRSLFTGKVLTLFHESLVESRNSGRGLRIRFRIDPGLGRVLALPWELLHRSDTEDFLGLGRSTPVVRCLDVPRPAVFTPGGQPLRILAIAAAPRGYSALDLQRERTHLKASWKGRGEAEIVFLKRPEREELRRALLRQPFDILHFMGHGTFQEGEGEGALLFEAPDGGPVPVTGGQMAEELKGFPSLRLVVLNACQSARMEKGSGLHPFAGVASALLQGGVPAVVAMQSRISDRAAIAFSRTFYERLAAGDPVDAAVTEGRLSIYREEGESGGWNLPIVFLLGENGEIFRRRGPRRLAKAAALSIGLTCLVLFSGFAFRNNYESLRLNNEGATLASRGLDDEARSAFLAALKLDASYAAAHSNLAGVEERQGNYTTALDEAQAATRAAPRQASYHYNLGRLLARMGRNPEALGSLWRAVELQPCLAEAYNEIGNVYLDLDRPSDARRAIEAGLQCSPPLPNLYKNLGRVALAEGRAGEAVEALEEALRLYGRGGLRDVEEPTYWLAEAYARVGRHDLACQRLLDFERLTAGGISPLGPQARQRAQQERCEGVF